MEQNEALWQQRQIEKALRRARDEEALRSEAKSAADLRRENEVFARLARGARANFAAARSLG